MKHRKNKGYEIRLFALQSISEENPQQKQKQPLNCFEVSSTRIFFLNRNRRNE